jgi:hypothetical protein
MNIGILSNENDNPILRIGAVMPSVFDSPEKEREIAIVGAGHIGRNDIALRAAELAAQNIKVIIIGDNNKINMNTVEINGIRYREKEKEQNRFTKTMSRLMLMASAFADLDPYSPKQKTFEAPDVNIVTEYELIQKKQSKLAKSKRDWVVWQFERNFERVS